MGGEGAMPYVKRREFITLLGGAATAIWPLAARGQQPTKLPTIGFLGGSTASTQREWTAAFAQRLRELGWIEGRTIAIEYRWAEGRSERAAAVAADPVGAGLVASLSRPGGNVTGLSTQFADTGGKKLGLLREAVPGLRRLAILGNVGYAAAVIEMSEVQTAARTFGLEVAMLEIRRAEDIAPAFTALKDRAEALYVCADALTAANRNRIYTFALVARLPTISGSREQLEGGG
jgi:putative ABC transport system substrate-binding protein